MGFLADQIGNFTGLLKVTREKEVKIRLHLERRNGVRLREVQSHTVHSWLTTHCVLIPKILLTSVFWEWRQLVQSSRGQTYCLGLCYLAQMLNRLNFYQRACKVSRGLERIRRRFWFVKSWPATLISSGKKSCGGVIIFQGFPAGGQVDLTAKMCTWSPQICSTHRKKPIYSSGLEWSESWYDTSGISDMK